MSASVNSRKDKSLRVMSQKFVMLFLVSNPRVVSLDVAAKILIGEDQGADQDKNKFKSESRSTTSGLSLTLQLETSTFATWFFFSCSQSAPAVRHRECAAKPQTYRESPRERRKGEEAGV